LPEESVFMPISVDELRPLGELPEAALRDLAEIAVALERQAGSLIFQADEPSPGLFIVRAGRVKVVRESPSGREQVLHVVEAGQHFNLVPAFDGGPCPASAIAMSDVRLLLVPTGGLLGAARRHPDLALALLAEAGARLRGLVRLVDDLALHTVQSRLARMLLEQATAAEAGAPRPPLTQAEMAARLGTVREMVGRSLKTFEQLGLISVARGTIALVDRAGLEAQAEQ
jgi:CRP/FNR family cyclic AMP-dependent transcriptional regulator